MKKNIILLLTFLISIIGFSQKQSKIDNLKTFAKAYGYVKYFHPSDEAANIDWGNFSIYGAKQIEMCSSQVELISTLNQLFKPIAPSIIFSSIKQNFDYNSIIPSNTKNYEAIYWQHKGVSLGMQYQNSPYKSIRVKRVTESDQTTSSFVNNLTSLSLGKYIVKEKGDPIFDAAPKATDLIDEEIGNGIFCQIPLSLYFNKENTYPIAEKSSLSELKKRIENSSINPNDLSVRLGNTINVYNVFQHFYPYFDVINVNWEKELETALIRCFTDKTDKHHLVTLQKFTAPLKDGHITILGGSQGFYVPPISWEWIENKLVITKVWKDNIRINTGDVVTKVNNQTSEKYFAEIKSRISAGTKGWLNYRAKNMSLIGEKNENMSLEINGITHQIIHDYNILSNHRKSKSIIKTVSYKIISDSIFYLNLDLIEMDTINKLLPQLEKSKAIICDLRGYPNNNHDFICHLLKTDDTTSAWMQIPQFIYPNQKNVVGFDNRNWKLKAKKPYLGNKNIVFITDGSAISYAESYMGYIEGYKLATIIGQPTAGTNGNINPFYLPGGYLLRFTGMKVLKHDYSQHHAIGILPNIYVNKTIEGVISGKDEFLEKAIEIIQN